jgi:hypothetical protein
MATQSEAYWFQKYLDVQFVEEADEAAKKLVGMFREQYSSDGPFYKGDFEYGKKLKLLINYINENLPKKFELNGKVWNLQDVKSIGARDGRSFDWNSASEEEMAAMEVYQSVLSTIKRYELKMI